LEAGDYLKRKGQAIKGGNEGMVSATELIDELK